MKNCCKNCGYLLELFCKKDNQGNITWYKVFPGAKDNDGVEMNTTHYKCMKFSVDGDIIDPNSLEDENCCDDFDENGVAYINF